MSRGLNKVMIIGHLGREPEMRYTPSGRPVTSFSVATTRSWNSPDGERREETEWFNVVAWGNLAEICKQYLAKGQQVYVEGRLQTRQWDDDGGVRHWKTEVVIGGLEMLSGRGKKEYAKEAQAVAATGEDGLPAGIGGETNGAEAEALVAM